MTLTSEENVKKHVMNMELIKDSRNAKLCLEKYLLLTVMPKKEN